ncbi:hypothetical protein H8959_017708 [Pygathrix nigripes]
MQWAEYEKRHAQGEEDLALEEAVLEELTQKVAQEHKAHSGILPAEAELMYINEVERLDGFGQEIFPVKFLVVRGPTLAPERRPPPWESRIPLKGLAVCPLDVWFPLRSQNPGSQVMLSQTGDWKHLTGPRGQTEDKNMTSGVPQDRAQQITHQ